jgi:hypothetical protein
MKRLLKRGRYLLRAALASSKLLAATLHIPDHADQ